MTDYCKTKYPVVLVHGINSRGLVPLMYWGRIPYILRKNGAKVYISRQDAWGTIENNALQLKEEIEKILLKEKCGKVNIIAHSKGGLDARYLVSSMGYGEKIASLCTVSTPHHGSKTLKSWYKHEKIMKFLAFWIDGVWHLLRDENPDSFMALKQMISDNMKEFNSKNADADNVYYQSWGTWAKHFGSNFTMMIANLLFLKHDGINDGLVSHKSAVWTNYRGTLVEVNHQMATDRHKKSTKYFKPVHFYCNVVHELKMKGY